MSMQTEDSEELISPLAVQIEGSQRPSLSPRIRMSTWCLLLLPMQLLHNFLTEPATGFKCLCTIRKRFLSSWRNPTRLRCILTRLLSLAQPFVRNAIITLMTLTMTLHSAGRTSSLLHPCTSIRVGSLLCASRRGSRSPPHSHHLPITIRSPLHLCHFLLEKKSFLVPYQPLRHLVNNNRRRS